MMLSSALGTRVGSHRTRRRIPQYHSGDADDAPWDCHSSNLPVDGSQTLKRADVMTFFVLNDQRHWRRGLRCSDPVRCHGSGLST